MSFISVFYLVFLLFVTTFYYLLPVRCRVVWLLLASWFFYFTWQPAFLLALLGVSLLAFLLGKKLASITDQATKKRWLLGSIIVLLLPLSFFKYFNFLNALLTKTFSLFSQENPLPNQPYLIPLGISFFTFQALSYVADIYRGYLPPESRIEKFALYMAFFPTILAGPIERAKAILGQLDNPVLFQEQNIRAGLQLLLWGVFKKVFLADRMAIFMKSVYAEPQNYQGILVYLAIVFSVFQLFCDFSAYSDIAVGSARMFGIRLTKNFDDRVYAAPSRTIFWQGWHRSLTSWLRDYVFFPLSRGVKRRSRMYLNLLLVYFLVGIWHGATWGFIVWGLLNGLWLIGENATKAWRQRFFTRLGWDQNGKSFYLVSWLFIFHLGALFGIFFRTDSPRKALALLGNFTNPNTNLLSSWGLRSAVLVIVLLIFMDWINRRIPKHENFDAFISQQKTWVRWLIYLLLVESVSRYSYTLGDLQFMYFNF